MRLAEPRIQPIELDNITAEQRELLDGLPAPIRNFNIFTTMVRSPVAMKRFNSWGAYIGGAGTSLAPWERELAILRTCWLCQSEYEWGHHSLNAQKCGLSVEEIGRIKAGAGAAGWTSREAAILQTADDIVRDHFVSNETWALLETFTEAERMDLIYTVGQYVLASTIMNTFGVQLEENYARDPDFHK